MSKAEKFIRAMQSVAKKSGCVVPEETEFQSEDGLVSVTIKDPRNWDRKYELRLSTGSVTVRLRDGLLRTSLDHLAAVAG